jgi:hypothetical protein
MSDETLTEAEVKALMSTFMFDDMKPYKPFRRLGKRRYPSRHGYGEYMGRRRK